MFSTNTGLAARTSRFLTRLTACAVLLAFGVNAQADSKYGLRYEFRFDPEAGVAHVTINVTQKSHLLRQVRFHIEPERHREFRGDGEITAKGEYMTWQLPETGGKLEYVTEINHARKSGRYDSLMTSEWALFRGDDLVPPAAVRSVRDAESRARLRFKVPKGWSTVTPYVRRPDDSYTVEHAARRFDRPTGWMLVGKLGLRLEEIAGTKVVVAGPFGHGVRRQDILAFLTWTLPELVKVFPEYHEKLLIVSAGDPMWRGGLSGPASLFIHSDRPLISENGTSALLHELVHTAMRIRAEDDDDWIVEGFAEYYSLEMLRRSGTISEHRYQKALEMLAKWGKDAGTLRGKRSHGAKTALAVTVLREVDEEIRELTNNEASLDEIARAMAKDGRPVSLARLRDVAREHAGKDVQALTPANLPLAQHASR